MTRRLVLWRRGWGRCGSGARRRRARPTTPPARSRRRRGAWRGWWRCGPRGRWGGRGLAGLPAGLALGGSQAPADAAPPTRSLALPLWLLVCRRRGGTARRRRRRSRSWRRCTRRRQRRSKACSTRCSRRCCAPSAAASTERGRPAARGCQNCQAAAAECPPALTGSLTACPRPARRHPLPSTHAPHVPATHPSRHAMLAHTSLAPRPLHTAPPAHCAAMQHPCHPPCLTGCLLGVQRRRWREGSGAAAGL